MSDRPAYILVDGIELNDVQQKVNNLIEQGYFPQPLVVSVSAHQVRARYVVPMVTLDPWLRASDYVIAGIRAGLEGRA